jgi:hypothetical protein
MLLECRLLREHELEMVWKVQVWELPLQGAELQSKDSEILDDEVQGEGSCDCLFGGTLQVPPM